MNTIIAKSYSNIRDEAEAAATITPGMLVKRNSSDKMILHAPAGGPVSPLFAVEDELQGRDITTNYINGEKVLLWKPTPGDLVYALSDDTASGAISIGDFVESNGNGRLRKQSQANTGISEYPMSIVGIAREAVTPGATSPRFLVEII
jgi:hypothetical protein